MEFFPPLLEHFLVPLSLSDVDRLQLLIPPILPGEIAKVVFSTLFLKGARPNTILALVWQKLWSTIKKAVIRLLITSVKLAIMLDQ